MWDAAPAKRTRVTVAMLASILWLCSGAAAQSTGQHEGATTVAIWAAELTKGQAKGLNYEQADELRRAGVTAVIIDRSRLDLRSRDKAENIAELWNLLVIDVSARAGLRLCNSNFARKGQTACAVTADSVKHATGLARLPGTHLIIVRAKSVDEVRRLSTVRSRGRFVVLSRLGARDGLSLTDWQTAARLASSGTGLHLGAAAGTPASTVSQYFRSLAKVEAGTTASPTKSTPASPPQTPTAAPASGNAGVAEPPSTSSPGSTPTPGTTPPGSSNSGVANLFIDANGGTCARSATPVGYNDAAACSTIASAYAGASLGDTVRIRCGTYTGETISGASVSKGSPDSVLPRVVYRPADNTLGCVIIAGNLQAEVPHVEFHKLVISGSFGCSYRSDSVQTKGGDCHIIDSDIAQITMGGVYNFRIAGNDIGGTQNTDGIEVGAWPHFDGHHPRNGVIENNVIHDLRDVGPTEPHIDGLQFTAGEDIIVRSNTFADIDHQGILAQPDAGPINRITIENNLFRDILGGFAVWLKNLPGQTCTGNVINYNTSDREFTASSVAAKRCSGTMTGNIWPSLSANGCNSWTATFVVSYMVLGTGPTCGSNGYVLPGGFNGAFIDAAGNNYHLSASSAARGRGNPSVCPTLDIDADARSSVSICDAGSDEVP